MVSDIIEVLRVIAGNAAVEDEVVAAGEDGQRIELQVLAREHRLASAILPAQRRPGHKPCLPSTKRRAVCDEISNSWAMRES